MRLTTKGRYAVTAMLDLALHPEEAPLRLGLLSRRQHIPLTYLEQLAVRLRQQGLLTSVRGRSGGYALAKSPDLISIADILLAAEEPLDATKCGGSRSCHAGGKCLTHAIWDELNNQILHYLENLTLAELADRPDIQSIAKRQNAVLESVEALV